MWRGCALWNRSVSRAGAIPSSVQAQLHEALLWKRAQSVAVHADGHSKPDAFLRVINPAFVPLSQPLALHGAGGDHFGKR